jgi:hypothetical protein
MTTTEDLRARLVEHLAIRAYRTEDGDPAKKALAEYEQAAIREARAKALEEAADALRADTVVLFDTRDGADWLRDRAARERGTK